MFWDSIFAVLPVHVFFSWHHLCKERCRIKQTLCNSMARKSIAGLPIIQVKGTWRSQGGIILAQKSPMIKEWNSPLKYCSFLCAQSLVHINNTSEIWYIKCILYYQYDVNSVHNNSRGSCNRPYRNITFLRHENMRFFARSRVLVNKWVKAFYSIEYNQSNINNGSDRPSSSPYTNLRRLNENILFLTPRRSLAHIGTIYIVTGFAH